MAALAADLARLGDETWVTHFVTDHYQGDWSILPLRAPAGATHPILRSVAHPGITAWTVVCYADRFTPKGEVGHIGVSPSRRWLSKAAATHHPT